jgi:hypothetical protein
MALYRKPGKLNIFEIFLLKYIYGCIGFVKMDFFEKDFAQRRKDTENAENYF